jgi:hypothetical protein
MRYIALSREIPNIADSQRPASSCAGDFMMGLFATPLNFSKVQVLLRCVLDIYHPLLRC